MTAQEHQVVIYADGSCLGNPGPGGWAAVLGCGERRKEICGGFSRTTNNRMELTAVIRALESLRRSCRVDLYTDSRYVTDSLTKGWLASWRRKGWRGADNKPVKNRDLWERLAVLLAQHAVAVHWVAGHAGHAGNEYVDALARSAASQTGLPEDAGFQG